MASLHIEHIRPKKHAGTDDAENLALACIECNLRKGTNVAGYDPDTGTLTELFNPGIRSGQSILSGAGILPLAVLPWVGQPLSYSISISEERVQIRDSTLR